MTLPAGRILDMTAHGGMVSIGAPTTLIGGMPAARIGDMHTCPMVTVLVPHVGGPIVLGAWNVLVSGPPQARMTDMCVCVGPPSMLVLGSFTTLVGMAGSGAGGIGGAVALVAGGMLAGAGNMAGNYPRAFADPSSAAGYSTEFAPGIVVRGTPEFQQSALQSLRTLDGTPSGHELLSQLSNSGHTTTIVATNDANGYCQASNAAGAQDPSVGSDSTVSWNPNHHTTDASDPVAGSPGSTVVLAHELVHANHNANGRDANGPNDSYSGQNGTSARGEERATVGAGGTSVTQPDGSTASVPDHSNDHPTENSIRDDLGIPRRQTYYPGNWPGGAPW